MIPLFYVGPFPTNFTIKKTKGPRNDSTTKLARPDLNLEQKTSQSSHNVVMYNIVLIRRIILAPVCVLFTSAGSQKIFLNE